MRLLLPALLAVAVPLGAAPQGPTTAPVVAGTANRIEVRANGTPIADVLERIARQTGMKVSYEGGTPRTAVHTTLSNVTPAHAVVSVLEGLGLNYLMGLDASGTRVETLLVVSPGSKSTGSSASIARSTPTTKTEADGDRDGDGMNDAVEMEEDDPMAGAVENTSPVDPNDPMGLGLAPEAGKPVDPTLQPAPGNPAGPGYTAPGGALGWQNPTPPPPAPVPAATPPPPDR